MKKIITIIAALTLTLVSCKKESTLVEKNTEVIKICRLIEIEINNDFEASDIGIDIFKNDIPCSQTEVFKTGDKLEINIFNHYSLKQNVEVLIYSDGGLLSAHEKDLETSETMTINYTVN